MYCFNCGKKVDDASAFCLFCGTAFYADKSTTYSREIKKSDDQKENKYELVLIDGVKIITDTLVNEKKYDEIYKSYKKIKSDQAIQYIDIRFKYFNVK